MLDIVQVPILGDNYAYLLHEPDEGVTAAVDPGEAGPLLAAADAHGWTISVITSYSIHYTKLYENQ